MIPLDGGEAGGDTASTVVDTCESPPRVLRWGATRKAELLEKTWPRLEGLRTLVLDMLRPKAHPTHFTVDQAIETAGRIGARSTWFIHMSHEIRHAEVAPGLPAGMNLAWDGVQLG